MLRVWGMRAGRQIAQENQRHCRIDSVRYVQCTNRGWNSVNKSYIRSSIRAHSTKNKTPPKSWKTGLVSGTLLALTDGASVSFAVKFFRKTSGLGLHDALYTLSLASLPFSLYYGLHAIERGWIYWPGCTVFGTSTVVFRMIFRRVVEINRPLLMGAADFLFAMCLVGIGGKMLHTAFNEKDTPRNKTAKQKRYHDEAKPFLERVADVPSALYQQVAEQTANADVAQVQEYAKVGAITGTSLAFLAGTGLGFPPPLLVLFAGLEPKQAFATFVVGILPLSLVNIVHCKMQGAKAHGSKIVPFIGATLGLYYLADTYVLHHIHDCYLHGAFGLFAFSAGTVQILAQVKVVLKAYGKT
mmetsp:Transcript_40825/g.65562  ORF Transcript_40825/g.65562 Transcript_40825/m.65562 type:complete len:356 (-) Transcript_40825:1511-2578(-)